MSTKNDSQLNTAADVISAETQKNANSKARVAQLFKDIIENKLNKDQLATVIDINNAGKAATVQAILDYFGDIGMPLATINTPGIIKVGNGLDIDIEGTLSVIPDNQKLTGLTAGNDILIDSSNPQSPTISSINMAEKIISGLWLSPIKVMNYVPDVFKLAHGTCQMNNKFYIGTMEGSAAAGLICFNDPDNDINDYTAVNISLEGIEVIGAMVADPTNGYIYASIGGDAIGKTACILAINPDDITDHALVFQSSSIDFGILPGMATDGVHVYVASFASGGSSGGRVYKIRISDWTLVAQVNIGHQSHAMQCFAYSDRTELYVTSIDNMVTKIDATDMSIQGSLNVSAYGSVITDDFCYRNIDDNGGICYIGMEDTSTPYKSNGVAVNTEIMTVITDFKIQPTYGIFSDGTDLYCMGAPGFIEVFRGFDLTDPTKHEVFFTPGMTPNEFLFSTGGKKFFTTWTRSQGLVEFELHPNTISGKTGKLITDDSIYDIRNGIITGITNNDGGYTHYRCQLFKTGGQPYDITLGTQTFPGFISWDEIGTGVYRGTLEGAFAGDIQFIHSGVSVGYASVNSSPPSSQIANMKFVFIEKIDDDTIFVHVLDKDAAPVDGLVAYDLEIRRFTTSQIND